MRSLMTPSRSTKTHAGPAGRSSDVHPRAPAPSSGVASDALIAFFAFREGSQRSLRRQGASAPLANEADMAVVNAARSVMHLVESSGGGTVMYGKERVIHSLMRAQRERGAIAPRLAVLSACVLADVAIEEGYDVDILGARERTLPFDALGALARAIRRADRPLLHTHGYKANIIGRIMRVTGARISGLVS